MELDPVALRGGMNGEYTPDWYNYANGNPLRWTDRRGLCLEDACIGEGIIAIDLMLDFLFGYGLYCALSPDHCTKPSPAPPPPPNQCQGPPPMPVPILGPVPDPLPWDMGKGKGCNCRCYGAGMSPNPIGTKKDAFACQTACEKLGYSGYRCGNDPVQWPN